MGVFSASSNLHVLMPPVRPKKEACPLFHNPIFTVAFTLIDRSKIVRLLDENKIPVYYSPERAVKAFAKLIEWKEYLAKIKKSS